MEKNKNSLSPYVTFYPIQNHYSSKN